MAAAPQQNNSMEFEFSDDDFNIIRELVFEKTGISIAPHKKTMVYGRIAKRIRKIGFKTFKQYIEFVTSDEAGSEIIDFVNAVTTNLTKFFREMHHFDHLKKTGLPEMIKKHASQKKLRIWSAGCSAGMEPYSIAMVLRSVLRDVDSWDAKILATDIDTNMLATGAAGEYKIDEGENIPADYYELFVTEDKKNSTMQMSPKLQKLIHFKRLNFVEPWPLKGPFDIIFCRNVVIYFTKETQKVLFNKFADVLAPGGLLYIGHSESLNNVCDRFELVDKTTYRKIK